MRLSLAREIDRTRPGHLIKWRLLVWGACLISTALSLQQAEAQQRLFGRNRLDDKDATMGVYLPSDRSLSRAMARAKEGLDQKEYHQAITFLQEVLSRGEDTFLERSDTANEQKGMKATARQMIGDLPTEGRRTYEMLNGATARKRLETALAAGDENGVAQVVRQFFHTPAGYEAALVLAQMEADRGHFLAAAELYRELMDTQQAAAQLEPQLSVLAATNQLAAGQTESAAAILRSLTERYPGAKIELAGRSDQVPVGEADPLDWLRGLVGKPMPPAKNELHWLTQRGNAARNARPSGGSPHLRARWEVRVVNDPTIEAYLTNRGDQLIQRGGVAIPGARPVAVGDVVLMRTPLNVVAVDWQTGKRIWETREEDEQNASTTTSIDGSENDDVVSTGNPLEQRVWEDALVMSLSSDGERAFVVRCPRGVPQDDTSLMAIPGNPIFGTTAAPAALFNQLVAYDLATQGKLLWELDGGRTAGPLAGAFFFGAPLAIDDTLYVMAEIRSAVYLVALEPRTGEVRWQQQLVGLEQGIGLDPARRLAGAMPSYADGILVCPTSAGAAVAIDVVRRELAWVYRYPRDVSPVDLRQLIQQQQNPGVRVSNRWRDCAAIIDDGRVFVTPPESGELYCLDLRTGKLLWKQRKTDALFVGCVDRGRVLLVGKDSLRALRVEDGSPVWADPLLLPDGASPSGQGYVSDGRYYLPVSTGGIVAVDPARGVVLATSAGERNPVLGNLICHRGSVISQTALVLDKFEQSSVLRTRAESALAKNPDDATALGELAEMRRSEGKNAEAAKLLKRALEIAPDDPLTQEMLVEVLLESLATDFSANQSDIPLVRRLIRGRELEVALMQLEAQGLDRLGERLAAWDAYLRLVDFTAEAPVELRISPDVTVRSDRWVRGRLGNLWAAATQEERSAITAKIAARHPRRDDQPAAAELRHYLAHFGELPGAESVHLQLAQWLVERQRAREAEIELLALLASPNVETQASAAVLMAQLLTRNGSAGEAAYFSRLLGSKWKDVSASEGLTGGEWSDRLAREATQSAGGHAASWPHGSIDARVKVLTTEFNEERGNQRAQPERPDSLRRMNVEQDAWPGFGMSQWFVSTDGTEVVGRNSSGDDIFSLAVEDNQWARQFGDSGFVHAARLGHLVVVSLGGQIVALDSRPTDRDSGGDVLWKAYPMGRFPLTVPRMAPGRNPRRAVIFDTSSGRRRMPSGAAPIMGSLGPVTPRGIVFQEQNEIKCVDPLSGEVLWMRTDVPTGCELFGDAELVFAADVAERKAYVFRMVDGQRMEDRNLPNLPWMLTAGRNVAQRSIVGTGKDRRMHLRVSDVESEQVLLDAAFDDRSQMTVVEPRSVAVYEPSGRFQLVDVISGQVRIDAALEPMAELQSLRTMVDGNELFVMVSAPSLSKENQSIVPTDQSLVNGFVYAFNLEKGTASWPGPAVVRNRAIILSQPSSIPVLMFVDRKVSRGNNSAAGAQIRLLCIDKRTGRTEYRNDELRVASVNRLRVRSQHDSTPTVVVEMNSAEVYLAMSDRPRPPQPPANDDLELPRTSAERGLLEVGRRMVGRVQNVLENQPAAGRAAPNAEAQDDQKGPPPAEPKDDD